MATQRGESAEAPLSLTLEQVLLVLQWASSMCPASQHEESGSLQRALRPGVLLDLLAQTVPALPSEPSVKDFADPDELGQLTVYCNACHRLGMRRLFRPADLLEGSGFSAVIANLLELRALHAARASGLVVDFDYSDGRVASPQQGYLNRTGGAASLLDPTLSMTYAEHAALYTGALAVTMTASYRARIWQVRFA